MENVCFILQAEEVVSLGRKVEKKGAALSDDLVSGRNFPGLGHALIGA